MNISKNVRFLCLIYELSDSVASDEGHVENDGGFFIHASPPTSPILYPNIQTDAVSMYDPKFCYALDVFLLLYGIAITALFFELATSGNRWRRDRRKPDAKMQKDSTYDTLKGNQSAYDELRRDPEAGRARGGRRKMDNDTYTTLKGKTEDTYKEIQTKKDRRPNDQVYQGLSSATKDTYDSLHMQPLPPRR